jgi:putative ABC transport system substrate-binding protein
MRSLLLALAWTLLASMVDICDASAQQSGRVYKIGCLFLSGAGVPDHMDKWIEAGGAFRDVLRDNGFVLGKNLVADIRKGNGDLSRLDAEAESLIAAKVDLIVSFGIPATVAAMRATRTIPIVFPGIGDPVERGIVSSLARPGGNVTGMALNLGYPKMWQLLRDTAPAVRRAGVLYYRQETDDPSYMAKYMRMAKAEAAAVGMEAIDLGVDAKEEIEPKFAELARGGDAAVIIRTDYALFAWREYILEIVLRHRLASACSRWLQWSEAGCLITYGEDTVAYFRGAANQAAKILKGAKPGDIPVEQATHFKLFINAKTARELGLAVPHAVRVLADKVIE